MSRWTHITSCISVDTCIEEKNVAKIVKNYLKKAPKITGSESNADIFVNKQKGYNVSIYRDCEHCEYKSTLRDEIIDGKYYTVCDGPDDYVCPDNKYQTCVVISIQGDLRDRIKDQTQKEFDEFLKYLEKEYCIRDYSLNIEGE